MNNEDTLIVHNERLVNNNNDLDKILNMINELPEAGSGGGSTPTYTNILDNTDFSAGGWALDTSGNLVHQISPDIYRFNKLISVVPGETLYLSKGLCLYYNSTDTSINYNTTGDLEIVVPTGVSQVGVRTFAKDFATFAPAEYIISRTPIEITSNEIYSTEETNTGKVWINGKRIYRKVLTTTIPTFTHDYSEYTMVTIDISSLNCDFVVSWDGTIVQRDGAIFWGLNWYNAVATASSITHIDLANDMIKIRENSNWLSGGTAVIILEYTKANE